MIDYTSDLHLDFWLDPRKQEDIEDQVHFFCENIAGIFGGDLLIIAGDIGHFFSQNSVFLKYLNSIYRDVVIVRGNHDLYLISGKQGNHYDWNSWNRVKEMKDFCHNEGIHYLDGNIVTIDGVKIGGVGMSWDFSFYERLHPDMDMFDVMMIYKEHLNDYHFIIKGKEYGASMYATDHSLIRVHPKQFFIDEYRKLQYINDVDIMVTHVSPVIPPTFPAKYLIDDKTTFFFFDGQKDIERISPKFWIFGHTHDTYRFRHCNTEFCCSPLGYPEDGLTDCVKRIQI